MLYERGGMILPVDSAANRIEDKRHVLLLGDICMEQQARDSCETLNAHTSD